MVSSKHLVELLKGCQKGAYVDPGSTSSLDICDSQSQAVRSHGHLAASPDRQILTDKMAHLFGRTEQAPAIPQTHRISRGPIGQCQDLPNIDSDRSL